jgi:DNA-binding transcriptional regulator YiaG
MDLGLSREATAPTFGVKAETLMLWELGFHHVSVKYLPSVIRFLGYDPVPEVMSLPSRLRAARRYLGLSQERLARRFGMDPKTIKKWEAGRVGRRTRRVEAIFEEFVRTAGMKPAEQDAGDAPV